MKCKIKFNNSKYNDLELNHGDDLSHHLTIQNSPILFGCRTGICGTCIIRVQDNNQLHPRTSEEEEYLNELYPGELNLRLACQVKIDCDLEIEIVK